MLLRTVILLFSLAVLLPAEPMIKVDKPNFDAGSVVREKTAKITHTFVVKNTGNKPLKITEVKPGCGCTVARFDSLIAPGKSGTVEQVIDMGRISDGKIKKSMSVTSNAKNSPKLELSVEATVRSIVGVSQTYARLSAKNVSEPFETVVSTQKQDFDVEKVTFMSKAKSDQLSISMDVPISVRYELVRPSAPKEDGFLEYTLRLFLPDGVAEAQQGDFLIQTNHPDKKQIKLQGMLEK